MYSLLLLGLSAVSGDLPPPPLRDATVTVQSESIAELRQALGRAVQERRLADALPLAKALTAHSQFGSLPEPLRQTVWNLIGLINLDLDRPVDAVAPLITASEMPSATQEHWMSRLEAQNRSRDMNGASTTVVQMLDRYPEVHADLSDTFLVQLAGNRLTDKETAAALRLALYRSSWRYEHASWVWVLLVDDLLEAGRAAEAAPVLSRITSPESLMKLAAMRRYDAVRAAAGAPDFDAAAVFAADLDRLRRLANKPHATLESRSDLIWGLFSRGRYEEALTLADGALAGQPPAAGSEHGDDYTWIMDTRARILMALGRPDEAIEQQRAAAARTEDGATNVSQTINLGWLYFRTGRNAEAMATVSDIGEGASPFGLMQAIQVRACAAVALGDTFAAETAYEYLVEHAAEAPTAVYEALACRGDVDAMARLLLNQFEDPDAADRAVAAMHVYVPPSNSTAVDARLAAADAAARARPEIIAARDRVGRGFAVPVLGGQF